MRPRAFQRLARPRTTLVLALLLASASCAHAPGESRRPGPGSASADSATILLWRMDEAGGYEVRDAGPNSVDGGAGHETDTAFGRYGTARVFTRSIESFVYAPYSDAFDSPLELTVEAWVYLNQYGVYEDTPIACRWTEQPNEKSWLFSVVGSKIIASSLTVQSPGYHRILTQSADIGHLLFVFQPADASLPLAFSSTLPVEVDRWVHVAATFDGVLVRLYIGGKLDSQFAVTGRIRPSPAPLLVGNYFNPRWLTEFGGRLQVGSSFDRAPYYAFDGMIDDLRISSVARASFPSAVR
jgi:hypothetical protein